MTRLSRELDRLADYEQGYHIREEEIERLRHRVAELEAQRMPINILFDGPPGPVSGRFIEVETDEGRGINAGEWIERPDGLWAMRIQELPEDELGRGHEVLTRRVT
uniref:Uncharacterized protein n=1 Tax=viral metagenome TaxID=1070528 RepID=A0A6M3L6N6_9ZZZZ